MAFDIVLRENGAGSFDIAFDSTALLEPSGIASAEAFGSHTVLGEIGGFTGISSAEAFGAPHFKHRLSFNGIASGAAFGSFSIDDPPDFENGSFEVEDTCGLADGWTFASSVSVEHIAGWEDGNGCWQSIESFEGGWDGNEDYLFSFEPSDIEAGSWNYQDMSLDGAELTATPINTHTEVDTQEGFEVGWPAPTSYDPLEYANEIVTAGNESYAWDFNSVSSSPATFNWQVGVASPLTDCEAVLIESFEQGFPAGGGNESYIYDFVANPSALDAAGWNSNTDAVESFESDWDNDTYYSSWDDVTSVASKWNGIIIRATWVDSSSGDVWAVGDKGSILYWDGSDWTSYSVDTVTGSLYGVWGNNANDVWACGANGVIIHWDGVEWSLMDTAGATNTFYSVSGVGGEVWFVGSIGKVLYWTDGDFTSQTSQTSQALFGVYARTATDVWAVGSGGVITHFNGTVWALSTSGVNTPLYGVWASGASSVWAVGNLGVVRFYNGSAWASQSLPGSATTNLLAIHGVSATEVYAVGAGGNIYKFNGSWSSHAASGDTTEYRSVFAPATGNFWVAGELGVARHYVSAAWVSASTTNVNRTIESFGLLWNSFIGDLA